MFRFDYPTTTPSTVEHDYDLNKCEDDNFLEFSQNAANNGDYFNDSALKNNLYLSNSSLNEWQKKKINGICLLLINLFMKYRNFEFTEVRDGQKVWIFTSNRSIYISTI